MTDGERTCSSAVSYADLGLAVLPIWGTNGTRCGCGEAGCSSPGKHPHGRYAPHGLKDATKDGPTICSWFENGHTPNLGLRTGAESDILVIDIDPRHGGDKSLASLGILPQTATVATGGGGKHLYFKMPAADIRNSAGKLGPGLDIRANGGYVVAPPSKHVSGGEYKWLIDPRAGFADLPQVILDKLTGKPVQGKAAPPVGEIIPKGQRDNTLTSLAGTMRRRGMGEAAILAALQVENQRCEEPLPGADLKRIARSIASKAPGDPCSADSPVFRPVYLWMKDVTAKPVEWLWRDRFPRGMLSLIIGVEGRGKTFVALDMAAHVTKGRLWPDGQTPDDVPTVGNVVFLTSEDHLEYTVKPRLEAMQADPAKVAALKGVKAPEGEEFFDVLHHLGALEIMLQEANPVQLLIVDPLTAFLGETDQHKNGEVRTALARFSTLAERYGCAIVGISHLSKDASKMAIHRTIGSVAFSATARAVWLVSEDRDDGERRLFVPVKMNLGPMAKSLAFRIKDMAVVWETGQFDYAADDVLAVGNDKDERSAVDDARQWLKELLADGRVRSTEVLEAAQREKVPEKTLRRAKAKLKVESHKEGIGPKAPWYWQLPKGGSSA